MSIRVPAVQLLLLLNIHADPFDYEANPAYTLVEAPHQKQSKFSNLKLVIAI